MTSEKALQFSLDNIGELPYGKIAPQHGSVICEKEDIRFLYDRLYHLKGVGIDGIIKSS